MLDFQSVVFRQSYLPTYLNQKSTFEFVHTFYGIDGTSLSTYLLLNSLPID